MARLTLEYCPLRDLRASDDLLGVVSFGASHPLASITLPDLALAVQLLPAAGNAERARALMAPFQAWQPRPVAATEPARGGRLSFAAFCGTCGLMTLAPLALIVLAH